MAHLAEGILRRLVDEPFATDDASRSHLASCGECQARSARVAEDAGIASALLARSPAPVDAGAALGRLRATAPMDVTASAWRRFLGLAALRRGVITRFAAAAAVVLAVAVGFAATGLAETILNVFQPKQFVAVRLSPSDYRVLPDLTAFGTMSGTGGGSPRQVADLAAAEAATGLRILRPTVLPAGLRAEPLISVVDQSTATFTFDAAVARANAQRHGATPAPMPAELDGNVLSAIVGPVVIQTYQRADGKPPDTVAVIQMRTPTVTSSKVSIPALRDYLLTQPGLSDALLLQIRAIGDPTSTLPIPLPTDTSVGENVSINGVQGLFIGDTTGLGSGVIWQKDGSVFAVGGTLTKTETLNVASSLR